MRAIISYVKEKEITDKNFVLSPQPPIKRSVFGDLKSIVYDEFYTTFEFNDGTIMSIETKSIGTMVVGE